METFAREHPTGRVTASSVARTLGIEAKAAQDALAWLAEASMLEVIVEYRCGNAHLLDSESAKDRSFVCPDCDDRERHRFATYKPTFQFIEAAKSTDPKRLPRRPKRNWCRPPHSTMSTP